MTDTTSPTELKELIALGVEQSGVEFKGPCGSEEKPQRDKILRAMLAMANHRDGGLVIVGVDETPEGLQGTGLTAAQLATWTRDRVGDAIAAHADPSVDFVVERVSVDDRDFVVLRVRQFADVPVVCKRNGAQEDRKQVLREGACYVRPRRKPESVEVPTAADMRDLLDLAIDRGVETFIKRMHRAGAPAPGAAGALDIYEPQRAAFEEEPLLKKLRQCGYWRVEMSPGVLRPRRVDSVPALDVLVRQLRIRASRSYPCSPETGDVRHGDDFTGQARDRGTSIDAWRLWQSGLFIHERALGPDWGDEASAPGTELRVFEVIVLLTHVYEFAARLARSVAGDAQMFVRVGVGPLTDRKLRFPSEWFDDGSHRSTAARWSWSPPPVGTPELVSEHRGLARSAAKDLFYRFGWESEPDVLRGLQDQCCPTGRE